MKLHILAIPVLASITLSLTACFEDDDKDSDQSCEERVRKEYPVPPGNINAQRQMIQMECQKK